MTFWQVFLVYIKLEFEVIFLIYLTAEIHVSFSLDTFPHK